MRHRKAEGVTSKAKIFPSCRENLFRGIATHSNETMHLEPFLALLSSGLNEKKNRM